MADEPANSTFLVRRATSPADVLAVAACFKAYMLWLNEDLTHQNYDAELNGLPGKYAPPAGALLLAIDESTDAILGCVAVRQIELQPKYLTSRPPTAKYCELKRLFVYPEARGRQVARRLLTEAISHARNEGYDQMLLDTLLRMRAAINLYATEGFIEVDPYNSSPLQGTVYYAKTL